MTTFDFNRSYLRFRIDLAAQPAITLTHKAPTIVNNVRIQLECRCEMFDRRTGRSHVYVLCSSCKTERVGVLHNVWLDPNADFCIIASADEFLVLKSWAHCGLATAQHTETTTAPRERQSGRTRDAWPDFSLQLRTVRGRTLNHIDAIIATIRGDHPLVASTQYDDGDFRVRLDYPVKTINYSERENVFQTDTGPILLPDLTVERLAGGKRLVECFDLAYAAFNSNDWAEFIVNVPTPVGGGVHVNHYSKTRRIEPVENSLIEVADEFRAVSRTEDKVLRADAAELPPTMNGAASVPNSAGEVFVRRT